MENKQTIRTISEILREADEATDWTALNTLWNEIVLNKYKYPLTQIWFARDHIQELREFIYSDTFYARAKESLKRVEDSANRFYEARDNMSKAGLNASSAAESLRNILLSFPQRTYFEELIDRIFESDNQYMEAIDIFGKKAAMTAVLIANNEINLN